MAVIISVLRTVGQVLLPLLVALASGKTLRVLVYKPLRWIARRTANRHDDVIVDRIRDDWQLSPSDTGEESEKGDI